MNRYLLLPIALIFFVAYKGNGSLPDTARIDSMVVYKSKRTLLVYENNQLLKTYKIALGENPVGHKQYECDKRTPEGLYRIFDKNPNSTSHKNLVFLTPTMLTGKLPDNWASPLPEILRYMAYPTDRVTSGGYTKCKTGHTAA